MKSRDRPQTIARCSRPLLRQTVQNFNVAEVSADIGYLSRDNMNVAAAYGATPLISFKSNSVCKTDEPRIWQQMFHYFQFKREESLGRYHLPSNVESTSSMVKAKFRDHIRAKTDVAMKNETLAKFLCHNICCLRKCTSLESPRIFVQNQRLHRESGWGA